MWSFFGDVSIKEKEETPEIDQEVGEDPHASLQD